MGPIEDLRPIVGILTIVLGGGLTWFAYRYAQNKSLGTVTVTAVITALVVVGLAITMGSILPILTPSSEIAATEKEKAAAELFLKDYAESARTTFCTGERRFTVIRRCMTSMDGSLAIDLKDSKGAIYQITVSALGVERNRINGLTMLYTPGAVLTFTAYTPPTRGKSNPDPQWDSRKEYRHYGLGNYLTPVLAQETSSLR